MSELTNYSENELLNVFLRNIAFTSPTAIYLAIFSAAPGEAGGGTEITDDGRKAIVIGAPSNGVGASTGAVTFAITTAVTVTHAALFDDPTAGNMLMYTPLTSPLGPTVSGDTIRFVIGAVTATFQ